MSHIHIREERCKGCRLCVSACPRGLIQPSTRFSSQGYTLVEFTPSRPCTACAACALMCPDCAISVYRSSGSKP